MVDKTVTFEPRKILCPIDFSELSDLALKYAAVGAQMFNSSLTVFHAAYISVPRYFTRGVADQIAEEIRAAEKKIHTNMMEHVESTLGSAASKLSLNYKFMQSHPVDAILETAEKDQNDLIVLGTHGFGGVKRLLMGSVAKGILESSKAPIFTVRQKVHDFIDVRSNETVPQIRNILCPCNNTSSGGPGLRYAVSLSERFNSKLTVLNIQEGQETRDFSAIKEEISNWVSDSSQLKCEWVPVVRGGNAAEQIVNYAKEKKVDLIVIEARHHAFHGGTFFGRTTELVVQHAPSPVLTVPIL